MSDFPCLCHELLECYHAGDVIADAILWEATKLQTIVTLKPSLIRFAKEDRFPRDIGQVGINLVFPCVATHRQDFGVFAKLLCPPAKLDVLFPRLKMADALFSSFADGLKHFTMEGKVVSLDVEKKKIGLSVLAGDAPLYPVETLNSFLQHTLQIKTNWMNAQDEKLKQLASLGFGAHVAGKVVSVSSTNVEFELGHGLRGVLPAYHLAEKTFKEKDIVVGCVLHCDLVDRVVYVTTRTDVISHMTRAVKMAPRSRHLKGRIILNTTYFSLVMIDDGKIKDFVYVSNMMNTNESLSPRPSPYAVGTDVLVVISPTANGKIATYHKQPKTWAAIKRRHKKSESSQDGPAKKKRKKNDAQPSAEEGTGEQTAVGEKPAENPTENPAGDLSAEVFATAGAAQGVNGESKAESALVANGAPAEKRRKERKESRKVAPAVELARLPVTAAFKWDDEDGAPSAPRLAPSVADSSDSEDEAPSQDKVVVKDRRERARQKLESARAEEAKLSEIEENLNDPERAPKTSDDFDRLVMASPNSSILWLQYMAFHLENAEIEKARTIAQRAIKVIAFREEQEKFNVWIAWLNLEHMYGTTEGYEETFQVRHHFLFHDIPLPSPSSLCTCEFINLFY